MVRAKARPRFGEKRRAKDLRTTQQLRASLNAIENDREPRQSNANVPERTWTQPQSRGFKSLRLRLKKPRSRGICPLLGLDL